MIDAANVGDESAPPGFIPGDAFEKQFDAAMKALDVEEGRATQ